jgi:probable LLM family oxidoreductase
MNFQEIKFGLDTFGDTTVDENGKPQSDAQTIRNIVAQAVCADELGLYGINIGEHHREDFAVSAPDTVLAGIATVTENIILGTGVTVLSSDDPVRVYQRFATVDALSNGRAEITAGRGSLTESFPLFGYNLGDYHELFEEKLELLVELLKEKQVTWSGRLRAPLNSQQVYPKSHSGHIPLRVGVGGSPESVVRAAKHGASLALGIIGGDPARFAPFAKLYRQQLHEFGKEQLPVSIHSPGYIAPTDEEAFEEFWPYYQGSFGRIGRERGWGEANHGHYMSEVLHGSMYVGSPETVAKKIAYAVEALGAQRFDLKYSNGPIPQAHLLRNIELYATEVVPRVKKLLAAK